MKKHLLNIERKVNSTDKIKFNYVLSQNEKNFHSTSTIFENFLKRVTLQDVSFYPNTTDLKARLSKLYNVTEENILLTPGSDIAIKTVFEAFEVEKKQVITSSCCFPMYDVYAKIYKTSLIKVPYTSMRLDIKELIGSITDSTAFVILANPNSPLGDSYSIEELEPLLKTGIPVVIDEAYQELSYISKFTDLIDKYPNLIVLKTLSKGYGAAGLRVGSLITNSEYMKYFTPLRFMYEISGLSAVYAECMLDNIESLDNDIKEVLEFKQQLFTELQTKNYTLVDTDSSWFFLEKTPKLKEIFFKHKVDIRSMRIPISDNEWYKFNVDLILKNSPLVDELLSNSI